MDKLSALFISGICVLIGICTFTIYTTWAMGSEKGESAQAVNVGKIEEEMALSNIAMNGDKQVINGGNHDMWIRVSVGIPKVNGKTAFALVSDTMEKGEKAAKNSKKAVWYIGKDGYYYYSQTVKPGEQSKPVFKSIKPLLKDKKIMPDADSIHVEAEAVQINWIDRRAKDAPEAFALFMNTNPRNLDTKLGECI